MGKVHDISVNLEGQAVQFPGDPPFERQLAGDAARGDAFTLSRVSMSLHYGTHIDMPAHFLKGGKTLADYGPERFILPAAVIEVPPGPAVEAVHLQQAAERFRQAGHALPTGMAYLFKTDNSRRGLVTSGTYQEDFTVVSLEAARWLVEHRAALAGIDYATPERSADMSFPVHKALLAAEIFVLEGLYLLQVPKGRYTLHCLPIKLGRAEAAPVRAVLVE